MRKACGCISRPTTKEPCSNSSERLDADPANADSYYNLGATHHQLAKLHNRDADYTQAESYYNQCIDKSPNHEECYRGLAVLLVDRGHPDQATQLLTLWSQRSPQLPGPRIELARLDEELGDKTAPSAS